MTIDIGPYSRDQHRRKEPSEFFKFCGVIVLFYDLLFKPQICSTYKDCLYENELLK